MTIKGRIHNFLYKIMSEKQYLKFSYWWYHRKCLSLTNPKTFSEKLYLLKIYNGIIHKEAIQEYYDKYKVRDYVSKVIGDEHLAKLYGVWNNVEEIDFDDLPDQCIFKISQSCGSNIICKEGYKTKKFDIKLQLDKWLKEAKNSDIINRQAKLEAYYRTPDVVIICEELLEDKNGKIPDDIRFYCFSGEVKFISVDYDTISEDGKKLNEYARNLYSSKGDFINANFGRPNTPNKKFSYSDSLDDMITIAEKLSEKFEFVRVDLYNVNGRIYFGELTWIPMGGAGKIEPMEFNLYLGKELQVDSLVEVVQEHYNRGN